MGIGGIYLSQNFELNSKLRLSDRVEDRLEGRVADKTRCILSATRRRSAELALVSLTEDCLEETLFRAQLCNTILLGQLSPGRFRET